jgi:hypothetical protein
VRISRHYFELEKYGRASKGMYNTVVERSGAMESKLDRKKARREIIVMALLNSIPDFLIAGIATAITGTGWIGFLVVFIGLKCVYFLIWLKDTLWSWVVFWLYRCRKTAEYLEEYLVQEHFPPPHVRNWVDYLSDIRDSAGIDCTLRIKAANLMSSFENHNLTQKLEMRYVWDDAFQRYARRFPRQQVGEDNYED